MLREILILIALSAFLGFSYSLVTKKGFFAAEKISANHPSANLKIITLAEAKQSLESNDALFIDTRHDYDYNIGHIEKAINISLNEFDRHRTRLDGIPKDKLLILYCDGEQCNSSIEMAAKLIELGFTNVKVFFGGWQEWKNAGLPIEK